MNSQPAATHSGGGREVEIAVATFVAIMLGPFTLITALVLAVVAQSWRRLWLVLASLPGLGGALLLWPVMHRHYHAAIVALHGLDTRPTMVLARVWPQLWPAWIATITLTPLVTLAVLAWQSSDLDNDPEEKRRASLQRVEKRTAKRAVALKETPIDPTGQGVFLGYRLAGDGLLPVRRGRVYLPLNRLAHHLLVVGATGSGKTETVLRLVDSVARTTDWTIVYIDGKGDSETMDRFNGLMAGAGRDTWLFPDAAYNGWRGTPAEIAGRLLELIDFADDGGGAYYRDLAVNTVRLACDPASGPPRSSDEFLRRLRRDALGKLYPHDSPTAAEIAALTLEHLDGIRARYAAFFTTVGTVLDGDTAFDQIDTGYFLLDGLRLKYEAGYLARFLIEEFTQWAVGRKPRDQRVLLVVDEFSAIATAGTGLIDVVERARGFGVAAALCPQVAEGMGGEEAAARIIGSTHTILMHKTALPTLLADVAGTRQVYEVAHQLDQQQLTGLGSTRLQHQYRVNLDEVRRLRVGQCFAITPGRAMKVQVARVTRGRT